jgi:PAS domain S-box-containing protein
MPDEVRGNDGVESASVRRRIAETESRFRTMADHAPVLLWMAGLDGLCDFFNHTWLEFTGRTLGEELGNGWAEGVHAEDLSGCMQVFLEAFVARRPFAMEYRLLRRDGVYRWIFDQGAPRFDGEGTFVGFIGSCVDVTSQRDAREALARHSQVLEERVRERTALASEREVMLREVHHRVKNDLQLISSLLAMHGRQFADTEPARAFEECQNRVQAIARVHEHLLEARDRHQVAFSEHLRTLTLDVRQTGASPPGVELILDIGDDVVLGADQAVPCVMIVHELCVNAFKHAFPSGRHGTVRVMCRAQEGGAITLSVEDDGVGMAEVGEGRGTGLGWTLVDAFARQLGARLELDTGSGTRISLAFESGGPRRRDGVSGQQGLPGRARSGGDEAGSMDGGPAAALEEQ